MSPEVFTFAFCCVKTKYLHEMREKKEFFKHFECHLVYLSCAFCQCDFIHRLSRLQA